ncbi:hypothetical protein EW146_g8915 [Bondarzewia mesenterica]|uniref:Cytochrome P450 n=1 Tax=Bondarzewia mesenterica TaxID=1095465 RepID=A0A4S4LBZ1_9AGAM|nr:hypothetical protein EW146_g8915 [Bondarzewia mesenterica]
MHALASFPLLPVALSSLALYLVHVLYSRRRRLPLPPGPRGWPVIGNLFDLPAHYRWITFAEWGKKYGDIVYTSITGRPIIILNSLKVADDIIVERSVLNSDRPKSTFSGDLVGWNDTLVMLNYGEPFRQTRRYIHQLIGTKVNVCQFSHTREIETRRFLLHMLEKPGELQEGARIAISSFILRLSHGYTVDTTKPDPLVELARTAIHDFTVANEPGALLVDSLPILRYVPDWFPGAGFKQMARNFRRSFEQLVDVPFEFVKKQVAAGKALRSFTSAMLEEGASPEEQFLIKWTAISLDTGGVDTLTCIPLLCAIQSVATICTLFLAMVLHPEVQKKAQAEIDAHIGSSRLPTWDDKEKLPYISAVLQEVLRWNPPAPLGTPHKSSEDDAYGEYFIPKGATIVGNIWAMCHDERVYSEPMKFNPERFLGEDPEPEPFAAIFGFGRRACPGRQLAEVSLFVYTAMILATLNISRARDANGFEVVPPAEFASNLISHPKPFKYRVGPRSPVTELLIRHVDEECPRSKGDATLLPPHVQAIPATGPPLK